MFLAIINDTYSEVKEDLATRESEFDLGAFLKKGYANVLTKLNLKKDRLKDIADALDSADMDKVITIIIMRLNVTILPEF